MDFFPILAMQYLTRIIAAQRSLLCVNFSPFSHICESHAVITGSLMNAVSSAQWLNVSFSALFPALELE